MSYICSINIVLKVEGVKVQNIPNRNSKVQVSFSKEEKMELEKIIDYYYGMNLATWLRSTAIRELRRRDNLDQLNFRANRVAEDSESVYKIASDRSIDSES